MTRIAQVIDEALAASTQACERARSESHAVKEASAQPRTEIARGLSAIGASLREDDSSITYADIRGLR